MGLLVDGAWQEDSAGKEFGSRSTNGHFIRKATAFHNYITADGSPGPTGKGGFPSRARPLSSLRFAGLPVGPSHADLPKAQKAGGCDLGFHNRAAVRQEGWEFGTEPGATLDTVNSEPTVADIYVLGDPHYTGRASVPVLWDKQQRIVVNNKSSEIIRMLNSAFDAFTDVRTDYYPADLREEIDAINDIIFRPSTTASIAQAFPRRRPLTKKPPGRFSARSTSWRSGCRGNVSLSDRKPKRTGGCSPRSFDRCGLLQPFQMQLAAHHRLSEFFELSSRSLSSAGRCRTVNLDNIKRHYYGSHRHVNPTGIVPIGPLLDFAAPHDRGRFG